MRPFAAKQAGAHFGTAVLLLMLTTLGPGDATAQPASASAIRFDVPQLAQAQRIAACQESESEILVSVELAVSVIVQSLSAPRIDQLLIEINPRGGTAMVADYAPRTELASPYSGGIEVQQTDEVSHSLGLALEGHYPPLASGNFSAGKGDKNIATTKFSRLAPLQLVAASGTTRRGRGVYFKFRSTDQQILEGDRLLSLTFRVPATWRGELIDVLVRGDSQSGGFSTSVASLAGMAPKTERVATGRFLVATYRGDDPQGRQLARRLADSEAEMRKRIQSVASSPAAVLSGPTSLLSGPTALLRHVSHRIDWNHPGDRELQQRAAVVLHRALDGTLDPHVDGDFKELPVDARVSCLDYLDARQQYLAITR